MFTGLKNPRSVAGAEQHRHLCRSRARFSCSQITRPKISARTTCIGIKLLAVVQVYGLGVCDTNFSKPGEGVGAQWFLGEQVHLPVNSFPCAEVM